MSTIGKRPLTPKMPAKKKRHHMAVQIVRTSGGGQRTLRYGRKLAIYLKCTECLGWEDNPRDCTGKLCPLYPFRGKTFASL